MRVRRIPFVSLLLISCSARAQTAHSRSAADLHARGYVSSGLVLGILVDQTPSEFAVQTGGSEIYRFWFDRRTWIERADQRISGSHLRMGELLEVVSDRQRADEVAVYARLVKAVAQPAPAAPRVSLGNYTFRRPLFPEDQIGQDVTFVGIATILDGEMRLITRLDGVQTFSITRETVFRSNGELVSGALFPPNTRVSVHAIQCSGQIMRAMEVIWGNILQP